MKLIDKDALVAEIEGRISINETCQKISGGHDFYRGAINEAKEIISIINTIEVKEVWISIPNIDDTLKEEGLDLDSKEAKIFKESYYMALEKLKAQKG